MISAGEGGRGTLKSKGAECLVQVQGMARILRKRGTSLIVKGKLYSACVRSLMIYGIDVWDTRVEDMVRAERMMVRPMCGMSLKE